MLGAFVRDFHPHLCVGFFRPTHRRSVWKPGYQHLLMARSDIAFAYAALSAMLTRIS